MRYFLNLLGIFNGCDFLMGDICAMCGKSRMLSCSKYQAYYSAFLFSPNTCDEMRDAVSRRFGSA